MTKLVKKLSLRDIIYISTFFFTIVTGWNKLESSQNILISSISEIKNTISVLINENKILFQKIIELKADLKNNTKVLDRHEAAINKK